MVILKGEFNIKEEIPTARFWLMTKLKMGWNKRWEIYIEGLRKNLIENMEAPMKNSDVDREKRNMAAQMIEKIERSAWATMPAAFLHSLKIERVLHR